MVRLKAQAGLVPPWVAPGAPLVALSAGMGIWLQFVCRGRGHMGLDGAGLAPRHWPHADSDGKENVCPGDDCGSKRSHVVMEGPGC